MTAPALPRRRTAVRTVADVRRHLERQESEAHLQAFVMEIAQAFGWKVHHMHDSRQQEWKTDSGFPDLVLCKPPRLLFVELKRQTGRFKPGQIAWLAALADCPGIETYTWRPSDRDETVRVLNGREG